MLDAILNRRGTRSFTDAPVSEENLHLILDAGFHANSAHHLRPCHFIVVDSADILRELYTSHPNMTVLKTAPSAVIVCGDNECSPDFWPDDCAAATQNMLIAAQCLELGSFWCAIYPRIERMEKVRALLGLPEKIQPYSVIALGTAAETKPAVERYNPDKIHSNIW